jgi:hypothetical protein
MTISFGEPFSRKRIIMKKYIALALIGLAIVGGLNYSRNNAIKSAEQTLIRVHNEEVKSDAQQLSIQINDLLLHYTDIGGGKPAFSFTKPTLGTTTLQVTLGFNPKPDGAQGYVINGNLHTLSLPGLTITGSITPHTDTSGGTGSWCIVERFGNFIAIADQLGYQATYTQCFNGQAR